MGKKKNAFQTVQETNDSSILSKASIAKLGYFEDPYLQYFTSRVARRSPLIHRGYYIRAKAIDYVLNRFLKIHEKKNEHVQIISLGAGFDTSYFRLKNEGVLKNCSFIEVDFPNVIQRKIHLISKNDELKEVIGNYKVMNSVLVADDYRVIPCDMTQLKQLQEFFIICDVDWNSPTLLFSECVFTYVNYESSKLLLRFLNKLFVNSIVVVYEQVQPHDAFGQVMLKHFDKIQSPLRRISSLETVSHHKEFLSCLGYSQVYGFDMNHFYANYLDEDEKKRMSSLELFDEFEEWHLKCSHYCIVAGFQGLCCHEGHEIFPYAQVALNVHQETRIANPPSEVKCSYIRSFNRYGHSIVPIKKRQYFVSGGFGVTTTGVHDKLEDSVMVTFSFDSSSNQWSSHVEPVVVDDVKMKRMYHTITYISDKTVFLFGGRTSPKQACNEYGLLKLENFQLKPSRLFSETCKSENEPVRRWRHRLVKLKDKLYLYGGRTTSDYALSDLWIFDLISQCWFEGDLPELPACHSHSFDAWNNTLVSYGGLSRDMVPLHQFHLIHVDVEGLKTEAVSFTPTLPARYSHTTHVLDNNLLVVGGVDPSSSFPVNMLLISILEQKWQSVQLPYSDPISPLMMHNHASILEDEHLLIIGGGGNCFSFGTHFNTGLTTIDLSTQLRAFCLTNQLEA